MLTKRHSQILRLLESEGMTSITALADRLGVSQETVRRDVKPLTEMGSLVRIHGAVGLASHVGEAPFQKRMRENATAKQAIARAAAASIRDGDSVMLDTGTTTSFLARELVHRRRLTVVTNSSDIARTLATVNGNRVYMAGGELRSDSGAAFGKSAIDFVSRFTVTHAIISVGAVDARGVMDFELEEAELARVVLSRGEQRLVVTDATKFGRRGLVDVARFDAFDRLITDRAPPGDIATAMQAQGTEWALAQADAGARRA
ncbi:MAG: DeoR/GlpR family DNA-binding transcription regulator [Paracoccaceae bacterium]